MSVHFISGKPGNGKSLFAMRLIVDELVKGKRVVVTNVAIKPGELNRYLGETYPAIEVDLFSRLVVMNEDETARFWLIRGPGLRLTDVDREDEKNGKRLDFTQVHIGTPQLGAELAARGVVNDGALVSAHALGGVLYVIDEIHIYFDSRNWQTTGQSALFYLSQHRKLGDDVLCITQSVQNVEKRFRTLAQDFTYVKFLKKSKFGALGLFQPPAVFMRQVFQHEATGSRADGAAMETRTFALDAAGVASCYETAAGVGVLGCSADKEERATGLHYGWLIAIGVAGLGLLLCVPSLLGKGLQVGLDKVSSFGQPTKTLESRLGGKPFETVAAPAPVSVNPHTVTNAETAVEPLPSVKGVSRLPDMTCVVLDDGRVMRWPAGQVIEVNDKVVCPLRVLDWAKREEPFEPSSGGRPY